MLGAYISLIAWFVILAASLVMQTYLRYFSISKNTDFTFLNAVGFFSAVAMMFSLLLIIAPEHQKNNDIETGEKK